MNTLSHPAGNSMFSSRALKLVATLVGIGSAVVYFSSISHAEEHSPPLDHFKCYVVNVTEEPLRNVVVFLQDQFDSAAERFETAEIRRPRFFCNPTIKQHGDARTDISAPNNHLTFYRIRARFREHVNEVRRVLVQNQFGTQELLTYRPEYLLVPTKKMKVDGIPTQHDNPSDIDHFKCYAATSPPREPNTIRVQDQFDTELVQAKIRLPKFFCNPVRKIHHNFTRNIVRDIDHPLDHLTCYAMGQKNHRNHTIIVENQFDDDEQLDLLKPGLFCVPSQKLEWELLSTEDESSSASEQD